MARRRLTPMQRVRIFEAAYGVCHICDSLIHGSRELWDIDHVIPLALGGDDTDENMRPVHAKCHRGAGSKTSADVAQIAKAKRVQAKHLGAKRPKRTIGGKRFNGDPIYPERN